MCRCSIQLIELHVLRNDKLLDTIVFCRILTRVERVLQHRRFLLPTGQAFALYAIPILVRFGNSPVISGNQGSGSQCTNRIIFIGQIIDI